MWNHPLFRLYRDNWGNVYSAQNGIGNIRVDWISKASGPFYRHAKCLAGVYLLLLFRSRSLVGEHEGTKDPRSPF